MYRCFKTGAALSVLLVTLLAASISGASATNDILTQFAAHDAHQKQIINHDPYTKFMAAFALSDQGRLKVAYGSIGSKEAGYIRSYTQWLSEIPIRKFNKDEQLAYWLNLRNALIIRSLALNPSKSLKKSRGTPSEPGPLWTGKRVRVEGIDLSLHEIEQIILSYWPDPLVLYGLYQGSYGGPALPAQAFQGASVRKQLSELATTYINSKKNVRPKSKTLKIAAPYFWYKDALFSGQDQAIIAHLQTNAPPHIAEKIASSVALSQFKYNYKLDSFIVRRAPQSSSAGSFGGGSFGGGGFGGGGGS